MKARIRKKKADEAPADVYELTRSRFIANLARIENLVAASAAIPVAKWVQRDDLLRAALVLLHASLEDLLRTLLSTALPEAPAEKLAGIPLHYNDKNPILTLNIEQLARHKRRSVDELIVDAVKAHLDRMSFNATDDVIRAATTLGLDKRHLTKHLPSIATLMSRRHLIVHRSDRRGMDTEKNSRGALEKIGRAQVESWVTTVREVGEWLLNGVDEKLVAEVSSTMKALFPKAHHVHIGPDGVVRSSRKQ